MRTIRLLAIAVLLLSFQAFSQQNPLEPGRTDAPVAMVSFELHWKAADPQWYIINVESTGRASYQSQPRTETNETPGDPYMLKFTASQPSRTKIFEAAKALNYFQGSFESKYKVARTGDKTLTYRDGDRTTKTTLNYSDNQQMNQLISLFQNMSATFEFGRRLEYDLRFDKLGLDSELKRMEQMQKDGMLAEIQVIAPILQRIISSSTTMNMTRSRAQRLLQVGNSGSSGK